ncbi:unnamed protein product [Diamesa tonsa]
MTQRQIRKDEFDRTIAANKVYENQQNEMFKINRNCSSKSLNNRMAQERRELQIEEQLRISDEIIQQKAETRIRNDAIAKEESYKRRVQFNEEKMRQQVRENNQDLRELETKLRIAYVSKALAAQKDEKKLLLLEEKIKEKREHEVQEQSRLSHLEQIKQEKENDKLRKKNLREVLRDQIISSHQQNQLLYEEFLREKFYLDEIVKRIQEEFLEQTQIKLQIKEQTKREMEQHQVNKKELEKLRKIELIEENERILQYCQERDRKIQAEEKRLIELEKNRVNLNERMVSELSDLIEKKRQREELLNELYAFEQNEKVEERTRIDLERRFRVRVETRLALEEQLMDQFKRKLQVMEDDKVFLGKQMEMMAERDKIDQMSNERRRRKMAEHRKDIHELLEKRKEQRVLDIANEIKLRELEQKQETRKQEIIEEERIKMLKEHAAVLVGFLPPGVLRESDREHLPMLTATKHLSK